MAFVLLLRMGRGGSRASGCRASLGGCYVMSGGRAWVILVGRWIGGRLEHRWVR